MFNDQANRSFNRNFIRECVIVLLFFWTISFLIVFYRYDQGIQDEVEMQIEVMQSQNELLTRAVKTEIHDSINELIWYATEEHGIFEIPNADLNGLNQNVIETLLKHKLKYKRLVFLDIEGQVILDIKNENGVISPALEGESHLSDDQIKQILEPDQRTLLIQISEGGIVEISIRSSNQNYLVYMELELTNFKELQSMIYEQFGFTVGLTSVHSPLWIEKGDANIEPCVTQECTESTEVDDNTETLLHDERVIEREDELVTWSCIICSSEIPYGVERVVWENELGQVESNIMVLSFITEEFLEGINQDHLNEMKGLVVIVFTVQFVASIFITYMYHRYHQSQMALKAQATRDDLTGFLNRLAGFEVLRNDMALAERENHTLTLAFIDIDGLKSVNDVYGHDDGDALIVTIGRALEAYVREADSLVRIGGDEFILILPNCEIKKANDILSRSLAWLDRLNETGKYPWNASFSYGLSSYKSGSTLSADALVQMADKNMYIHKKSKQS